MGFEAKISLPKLAPSHDYPSNGVIRGQIINTPKSPLLSSDVHNTLLTVLVTSEFLPYLNPRGSVKDEAGRAGKGELYASCGSVFESGEEWRTGGD